MKKLISIILALCLMVPFISFSEDLVFGTGKVYVRAKGGTLHLRSEPTTESESLGIVHHGDEIDVLALGDEWSYIFSYREGKNGYIKTKYIVDFVKSENVFSEMFLETASASSKIYPIPGKYYLDLDGDGKTDTAHARLFYDENGMENFSITFETVYGSTGEATIPVSSYAAGFSFLKPHDSENVYVFVTGDECSSDFVTYCFYVEKGDMKSAIFFPGDPFEAGLGMPGQLTAIEDEVITIEPILDVLGTRAYKVLFTVSNGVIAPFGDAAYAAAYDLFDPEAWEYLSMKTKSSVPCFINGNAFTLDPGTEIIVTWLNVLEQEIGFTTKSGLHGYFEYQESVSHDWGVDVGGVYEEDAFHYIPYAG
ncbi:MAG: SH3 domain-containing protein [Clostridiales bacterium]|nr:SH3 domain-containing protein [Clostridiales bacterium]